jgi:EAL domain-containing protein (putative c-di-GMP-specific phosphodiesterase class I)
MTPKNDIEAGGLFQLENSVTHRRRVRLMLMFGSAGLVFLGTAWLVFFGARSEWLTMALDLVMVLCGLLGAWLTRRRHLRAAALLLLGTLFAVLFVISAFLDVPTASTPRSTHHFFLALAVSSFLVLRYERAWLRHGIPLVCLAAFLFFASTGSLGLNTYSLPDSVRAPGTWFNNLSALVILYLLLHIMQADVGERSVLEADLRKALSGNQFELHYQPQVSFDGSVFGAEALLRWNHPRRGQVPPDAFIGLAEQTGLIVPLGSKVLDMACRQLAVWAGNPALAHLSLSVNVSAQQLGQSDFVAQVLDVLERSGAPRTKLKLELTESMLVQDVEAIIAKMTALRAYGVGFALDDFGTGYSSLSYLKRLPLDQLKIDKAFVRDVLNNPHDAAIARTVVALGQNLGFAVVAEGVETEGQRAFLADHGCLAFQGNLFSRPLPLAQFQAFVQGRVGGNVVYLAA